MNIEEAQKILNDISTGRHKPQSLEMLATQFEKSYDFRMELSRKTGLTYIRIRNLLQNGRASKERTRPRSY